MRKLTTPTLALSLLLTACPGPDDREVSDAMAPVLPPDSGVRSDAGASSDARVSSAATAPVLVQDAGARSDAMAPGPAADAATSSDAGASADSGPGRPEAGVSTTTDPELQKQNIEKLKACGMYEPSIDPAEYSIEDEYDRCFARCVIAASCPQLTSVICEDAENTLYNCLVACPDPPADGFRCKDGSLIPHAALCDLEPDCDDEEDEANCGEFRCANGEVVPAKSARCDYIEDCVDGSDERGCMFSCP